MPPWLVFPNWYRAGFGRLFEGSEYVVRNPKRRDLSAGSFKVNTRTGKWGDFAAQVGGGDPISLWAFLDDVKQGEAAKRLAERLGLDAGRTGETKRPIVPVPADAPSPETWRHPKFGVPVAGWPYHRADGALIGYIVRLNHLDGLGRPTKDFMPLCYCDVVFKNGSSGRAWRSIGFADPRPLFQLPEMLASPDAPVIVTEGEKKGSRGKQAFSRIRRNLHPPMGQSRRTAPIGAFAEIATSSSGPTMTSQGGNSPIASPGFCMTLVPPALPLWMSPRIFRPSGIWPIAAPEGADLGAILTAAKTWTANIVQFPGADDRKGDARRGDWLDECQIGRGDMPVNNVTNAALGLRREPTLVGCVAYDAFSETAMLMRPLPRPHEAAQQRRRGRIRVAPWRIATPTRSKSGFKFWSQHPQPN